MKSLFLRIFLSFWMAQALFVVLAILVTIVFRPGTSTWEALRTTILRDSVSAYEDGGEEGLHRYFDNLDHTQHVRAYLFDEHGNRAGCRYRKRCVRRRIGRLGSRRVDPAFRVMDLCSRHRLCSAIPEPLPMGNIAIPLYWVYRLGRASSSGQGEFRLPG